MNRRLRVGVLAGGRSSEHAISLASAASVLRALAPSAYDVQTIEIGRDGLILEMHGRRGLLLPQVATEWGFDRERFLAEVSRKAGLPPEAWRDPKARIWVFRAEVFSE